MKSKVLLVFLGLLLGLTINAGLALPEERESTVTLVDYSLYSAVTSVGALHQIKIGEVPRLESHLEAVLALDIIGMSQELEGTSLSESDRERIVKMMVLVSVMNEKFEIESWRKNVELQNIFKKAQAQEPNEAKSFRCKDWSQPMWAEVPECA
jgi:hypothetical protein